MLNPAFSPEAESLISEEYVLPDKLASIVKKSNASSNTEFEYRTQDVFTYEIWSKLDSLGYTEASFNDKVILDLCAGSGFLTYHLLKRANPKQITLVDISEAEIKHAKKILSQSFPMADIQYLVGDVLKIDAKDQFDIVIGNSFIHHLYDVPSAIEKFKMYLKKDGSFISLHEPTLSALALEAGSKKGLVGRLASGRYHIRKYQYKGPDLVQMPFSGDVWIFDNKDVQKLFKQARFSEVKTQNWHLFRPYAVARKSLHLSSEKERLNITEEAILKRAIKKDKVLQKLLTSSFFGSVSVAARK